MTLYDFLMAFCVIVVVVVLVKGFWKSSHVKPIDQPDNWTNDPSRGPD